MLKAFITGWLISITAIIPIGAQNLFVLRQGILGQHIVIICLICMLCDTLLMFMGVFGLGKLFEFVPQVANYFAIAAMLFLLVYAGLVFKEAMGEIQLRLSDRAAMSKTRAILTVLAVTLLNPHVYVDTIFIIGATAESLAANYKLSFWLGCALASWVWFAFLGYTAGRFRHLFESPRVWRILNLGIAALMVFIALQIGLSITSA